jgi:hypothetical protein
MVITSIPVAGHAPGQLALALVPLDGDWKPRGLRAMFGEATPSWRRRVG